MEGVRLRAGSSCPEKTSCAQAIPLCPGPRVQEALCWSGPLGQSRGRAVSTEGAQCPRDQRVTLTV